MKIYTRTGDDGTTGLIGGKRVKKSSPRIIAYGAVDETNSAIGVVLAAEIDPDLRDLLTRIQNDLFVVGSDLANPDLENTRGRVTEEMTKYLESQIDRLEVELDPITYFILPGGSEIASRVHLARATCRRAEANIIEASEKEKINNLCQVYINRLSDLLFVIARTANRRMKVKDVAWKK